MLTWQVDKKIPGGMNLQSPLECTITFVGKALLKAVEAELNRSISGDHILRKIGKKTFKTMTQKWLFSDPVAPD